MSSSMPIPQRKQPARSHYASSSWNSLSSASSSYNASPSTPCASSNKGKAPASMSPPMSPSQNEWISPRRPSLMGSSLSKSEYTVISLGHGDGPQRLVTCVKSSQGFDWNQELFLPSYAAQDFDAQDLEHKQDPVQDIVLTDEEAENMLPR